MVGEGYVLINIFESEYMFEYSYNLSLNGFCDSLKFIYMFLFF